MRQFIFLVAALLSASAAWADGFLYVSGEVLANPKPDRHEHARHWLATRGFEVLQIDRHSGLMRVRVQPGRENEVITELSSHGDFEYAERNGIGTGGANPNDTFFNLQWHLANTGQSGGTSGADIDALLAWNITTGSPSVGIAVLDTGIRSDHPEFAGRIAANGWDFVNSDSNPEGDHGHGTWVSGAIAANANNNFAVTGVDWACKIIPIKVLNSDNVGTTFNLAQGLNYAAVQSNVQIVNLSLINYPCSTTLNNALLNARNAGKILLACAGNGGIGDADASCPGASPWTISIGWTTRFDARDGNSATGNALDFVAPGRDIVTTSFSSVSNTAALVSGCSIATPITAGVVGLLYARALELGVTLTHDAVYELLNAGAEDMVGPSQEDKPGWDPYFGHGRINAYRSLLAMNQDVACAADLNISGSVDVQDLLILLATWGPVPAGHPADLNGSGTVDVQDLLILLASWGECP
ncbi:MAG TPA: S8 family serine peptidase [Phycisphaerales bacterium]|nr:S8 family serine peptidase [Phycisphaerales bacterium]